MTVNLRDSLDQLAAIMTNYGGTASFRIADLILYNFAIDVREHGEAVSTLCDAGNARASFTNARAAIESSIDASYLAQDKALYAQRGARARVSELFELERLQFRAELHNITISGSTPDLENAVRTDAVDWDRDAPCRGKVLLGAYEDLCRESFRIGDHWSGHSRLELYRELSGDSSDGRELVKMLDVVYGMLSISAHPRPRTSQRRSTLTSPDHLQLRADSSDEQSAMQIAAFAVELTIHALQRRQTF